MSSRSLTCWTWGGGLTAEALFSSWPCWSLWVLLALKEKPNFKSSCLHYLNVCVVLKCGENASCRQFIVQCSLCFMVLSCEAFLHMRTPYLSVIIMWFETEVFWCNNHLDSLLLDFVEFFVVVVVLFFQFLVLSTRLGVLLQSVHICKWKYTVKQI